jgi:hypothetical protein
MENPNAAWVNGRGTWVTCVFLVIFMKVVFSLIPGVSNDMAWTLTNISYNLITFIFFHCLEGVPFDTNQGEYFQQTLWEQMDEGSQYSPSKKFLVVLPTVLFLISVHFSDYDAFAFYINFASLILSLVPKLPSTYGFRLFKPHLEQQYHK